MLDETWYKPIKCGEPSSDFHFFLKEITINLKNSLVDVNTMGTHAYQHRHTHQFQQKHSSNAHAAQTHTNANIHTVQTYKYTPTLTNTHTHTHTHAQCLLEVWMKV